jgi:hypothetical protein
VIAIDREDGAVTARSAGGPCVGASDTVGQETCPTVTVVVGGRSRRAIPGDFSGGPGWRHNPQSRELSGAGAVLTTPLFL